MSGIGGRIAHFRAEKGLTQENLADLLYVSRSLVSMWELGERVPDYYNVSKLAEIFNVRMEDIVGEEQYVYSSENELKEVFEEIMEFAEKTGSAEKTADPEKAIKDFLCGLTEKDRTLFMNRYFWMKTNKAIASELKMSETAVKVRLFRIRKKLKL